MATFQLFFFFSRVALRTYQHRCINGIAVFLLLSLIIVVAASAGFVIGHYSFESTGKQFIAEF